jgi:hypothetical protein
LESTNSCQEKSLASTSVGTSNIYQSVLRGGSGRAYEGAVWNGVRGLAHRVREAA